jgi:hypothetical protein
MSLLKKLKIKSDQPLWVINAPAECIALLEGQDLTERMPAQHPVPQLALFVTSSADLEHQMSRLAKYIGHDTLVWICYPKKSGAIASDLAGMKSWETVFDMGYRGQSSASLNENWSGLRVTNAPRNKPSDCDMPMEERTAEGIDFVKRTAQLPADALEQVAMHTGMPAYFDTLAFTIKKEYVTGITGAKKPETRQRRIEKMIAELQQKMHVKRPKQ